VRLRIPRRVVKGVLIALLIFLAYSFLQTLYFGLGLLELILVLILLGIISRASAVKEFEPATGRKRGNERQR
jgi:hypothetical protein